MKLLFYCTKRRPPLVKNNGYLLNGKIAGECDYEIEEIFYNNIREDFGTNTIIKQEELFEKSCTDYCSLYEYLNIDDDNDNIGYAIHIKNLKIFNEPRELKDFCRAESIDGHSPCWHCKRFGSGCYSCNIKAPQNMKYVYDVAEKKILIPIHPDLLCQILNGDCSVIVKKRILKGM